MSILKMGDEGISSTHQWITAIGSPLTEHFLRPRGAMVVHHVHQNLTRLKKNITVSMGMTFLQSNSILGPLKV